MRKCYAYRAHASTSMIRRAPRASPRSVAAARAATSPRAAIAQLAASARIALTECRLPKPAAAPRSAARSRCRRTASKPDGRKIVDLRRRAAGEHADRRKPDPARAARRRPRPGGDDARAVRGAAHRVRRTRDIVLVDQRGTGRSSPLDCAAFAPDEHADVRHRPGAERAAVRVASSPGARRRRVRSTRRRPWSPTSRRCARRSATDSSTCGAAATARASRRSTCAAIREHVRSVVLDGVAPPSMSISFDVWRTRDAALDDVIAACRASAPCAKAHPDPAATLREIAASARRRQDDHAARSAHRHHARDARRRSTWSSARCSR